jgi:hypothetical protein
MLVFVQAFGVGVGDAVGVEVGPVEALGSADALGLVAVPGSAQAARIDVAAAMASSPGVVLRIAVIRAARQKRGRTTPSGVSQTINPIHGARA